MIIPVSEKEPNLYRPKIILLIKGIILALLAFVIAAALVIFSISSSLYKQLKIFSNTSGMSIQEIKDTGLNFYSQTKAPLTGKKTILVLGVDKLETRPGSPVLTDTILLTTIDFDKVTVTMLPLPRDMWFEKFKARINTVYNYAVEQGEVHPEKFTADAISELIGIKIDQSLVVEMDELAGLIDLVGGVEVEITEGFVDEMFPRPDVDVTTVRDPELLYKTVTFEKGAEIMSGERSLEYIRSRKSNGAQGTDLARSGRQQQVIMAIFSKLKNKEKLLDPVYSGTLVRYYKENFEKYLPINEATHYVASIGPAINDLTFKNTSVSIYPEQPDGVLFHPSPKLYNEQWLYVIRDELKFKKYVSEQLEITKNETGENAAEQ